MEDLNPIFWAPNRALVTTSSILNVYFKLPNLLQQYRKGISKWGSRYKPKFNKLKNLNKVLGVQSTCLAIPLVLTRGIAGP